ncbi:MAG: hypothetical protein IT323_22030 [Anaerolineae bacterium]|nr:hypothetical protein [Anaerolineae bacterium]
MTSRLLPLHFPSGMDADFQRQLETLRGLLAGQAEILAPVPLGAPAPDGVDAVLFPQLLGEAYRLVDAFQAIRLPMLILTSEFGTMSMWDWEIRSYLRDAGVRTIAPYNIAQTRNILRALEVRRDLRRAKFVVFQDNPGAGFQAPIFKRFYWWEDECTQRILDKFGVQIVVKSFQELGARAKALPDSAAEAVWEQWKGRLKNALGPIQPRQLLSALKVYLVLRDELDADPAIAAMGMNCLNESHFSDSTPCLAWNMLYEERKLMWGCEADTVSMLTKHIVHKSLDVPIMMSNLYPFLMGQAALKHERIPSFPDKADPDDHVLVAHCGYLGVLPQSFATEWTLRPKVLAIVDDNATAIDARLPEGPMTMVKLQPNMEKLTVIEGSITGYAQYPGSDCLNGAVLHIPDGHRLMDRLSSHHYLLTTGHNRVNLQMIGGVFGLELDVL